MPYFLYNIHIMKKVLVGLSGGVDSAVAAWLLKEQGYDVTCAFMRNWDSAANDDILGNPTLDDPICTQEKDYNDAKQVADALGLELLRIDFIEEYWQEVFQTFLKEYRKGRTPNPDILCNRYIKFDHFLEFARARGFETLATGHYARIGERDGHAVLMKADDRNKDQSYFLCQIRREVLDHVLFPLGHLTKPEIRRIAADLNLPVADKKDSTGICFIGERNFREFLKNYLPMKEGNIVFLANKTIVGHHQGVFYYTIGQRKGLDIGGTGPYYVCGKDIEKNELYVTDEAGRKQWLYSDSCLVTDVNQLDDFANECACTAKFRYRQPDRPVTLLKNPDGTLTALYPSGYEGITPGQEAVFYMGDILIASGTIDTVYQQDQDLMAKIRNYMKED